MFEIRFQLVFMTIGGAFGVEVIATMVLVIGVYVVSDEYHQGQINAAVTLGVLLLGIGASMGQQTGYALNPARDLSPRLFTYRIGLKTVKTEKKFEIK